MTDHDVTEQFGAALGAGGVVLMSMLAVLAVSGVDDLMAAQLYLAGRHDRGIEAAVNAALVAFIDARLEQLGPGGSS